MGCRTPPHPRAQLGWGGGQFQQERTRHVGQFSAALRARSARSAVNN